ncbi:hypothetical protein J2S55_001345 [Streptosporangium brasiliense]|uniref:Uncharacterized protein n=1 Tax=Streptosporangium brasiliense TaxID=47480 RepID=A0ABT9QZJ5_9ACTN|nr:hypothetical protein [Streptosporangium brasiliense]
MSSRDLRIHLADAPAGTIRPGRDAGRAGGGADGWE